MTTFADLGLSPRVLASIERLGYTAPTPVQEQAIPLVLAGRDIIAAAKTGTGKTAAFSLPAMARLEPGAKPRAPRMLVITPTRELASQIAEVCALIAKSTGHRLASVVGGVSMEPQIQRLQKGPDVLIATPGRLLDLMGQGAVALSDVQILVLDEADRMLDMGFLPSVTKIVNSTPKTRQTLLFSATVDASVKKQVGSMLHDPALVQIAVKGETADTVDQYVAEVPHTLKPAALIALLRSRGSKRVIVFARTRHRADAACRKLKRAGFSAEAIHSDRNQNQRRRALDNFANGATDVLVATDVLARGIDVEEVAYVVNYDVPTQPEDYVHRIGRTGRAGARGFAISFASPENADDLAAIEKFVKRAIPRIEIEGFDVEQAAAEAAAQATRAAAKHDPELAAAARELAKKERKRERARQQAADERASAGAGSRMKAGAGASTHTKRKRAQTSTPVASSSAHASTAKSKAKTKPKSAPKPKPKAKAKTSASAKPAKSAQPSMRACTTNAPAKTPAAHSMRVAGDVRPGRAHRAAVAEQRRKKR